MISLAFLGPMPWIYCKAITTRLFVGMLTPAMRATVVHSFCPAKKTAGRSLVSGYPQAITRHPSPFPGARASIYSRLGCALLMDSTPFRQPPAALGAALGFSHPWLEVARTLPIRLLPFALDLEA